MTHVSRRFLPAAAVLGGAFAIYLLLTAMLAKIAHADPVVAVQIAADAGVSVIATYGLIPGIGLTLYSILSALLKANESTHWIAQGRTLSLITAGMTVAASVVAWYFNAAPATSIITAVLAAVGLILHPTTVAAVVKATPAALVLLMLGVAGTSQISCSDAIKQRGANATGAFMDCEARDKTPFLPDAISLAKAAVMRWISGSGTVDASGLRADASGLKSDLGKCAWDAAIAAIATPAPAPKVGAPASAALAIDGPALRSTWATQRAALGWAPLKAGQ